MRVRSGSCRCSSLAVGLALRRGRCRRCAAHAPQPLASRRRPLTQDGQDLVWQVELAQLVLARVRCAADHESLCLLIERASNGSRRRLRFVSPGPARANARPGCIVLADHARRRRSRRRDRGDRDADERPGADRELPALERRASVPAAPLAGNQHRERARVALPRRPAARRARHCSRRSRRSSRSTLRISSGASRAGPDWVFTGPRNVHDIALTFDDGPWWEPPTVDFVNELARLHVPATFFEIGEQIPTYDPPARSSARCSPTAT